jgi:hypothetical protein
MLERLQPPGRSTVTNDSACDRCRDLLPEYAAGTLAAEARAEVERHLASCAACAAELGEWRALATALHHESRAVIPPVPFDASWGRLAARLGDRVSMTTDIPLPAGVSVHPSLERAAGAAPAEHSLAALTGIARHVGRVLTGQVRLLRPAVWVASALGIALAVLYALTLGRVVGEQDVLAFALPLIAATGIAFLYGPDVDAGLELALATPTSPRLVLLGRFALLFGYDTALALLGTLLLALVRHDGFAVLTSVWLGPMALLSTLSLAVSLVLGPAVAVGGAAALWLARSLHWNGGLTLDVSAVAFWQTSPQILLISLAILAVALLYVPRQQRLRPDVEA